ncbi:DUF6319 family protein [Nocardia yamanashiensis]|uniref:DUF6319 family protein n=1 Tax=Nocardia yamanashiensis TaxID=209247 RepID=UPI00082E160C|nr:DUF6319 family protein [Nocardia yamanashiensis]
MSSRSTKAQPLSETEIRQIADEIDAGRPPMVWFTASAVGVPEGRSGKVISLGDPSEGDFLQVKPTGSKDVLSFGPTEVTLTKPARKDAAAGVKPKSATRKDSTVTMPSPAAVPATPPSEPVSPPAPKAEAPQPSSAPAPAAKPAGGAATAPAKKSAPAAAKKAKTPEVTVTLLGTADGEWTVEVVAGKKRTKGLPVPSSAVSQAAKLLHPEVAEVVDGVLESVRASQRAKVEALQAELESARKLLDELAG